MFSVSGDIITHIRIINIKKVYNVSVLFQCSGQRDYVIHLARTPLPSEKTVTDGSDLNENASKLQRKSVNKLTDIQEIWLADHAKQVVMFRT